MRQPDAAAPPCVARTLAQRAAAPDWWPARRALRLYERHRLCRLALSRYVTVSSSQVGGITWADLDPVEQRYLLTAAADSTVEAFDAQAADDRGGHAPLELQPLFTIKRGHPAAHRYQVTSLVWYPVDTGLFVTGSADCDVKVWDANLLQVACAFSCPAKVTSVAMSGCAAGHALVAVGSRRPELVLADIASGAFTHTLDGHSGGAWCACWSVTNEYQLLSGDGSGAVRLWDIRRAGCRALLDMHATSHQPPPATAACGGGGGKKRRRGGGGSEGRQHDAREQPLGRRTPGAGGAPAGGGALAHEGAVTAIHATQDGRSIVTAGCDHRVRLWDSGTLCHQLVHYPDTFNKGTFPKRLASTPDGRALFVPRGSDVQAFDTHSGRQLALLSQGHYEAATACLYSNTTGRLWSAGLDGAVLAWEPWLQDAQDAAPSAGHATDWWLAAAAAGRGTSGRAQAPAAGPAGPQREAAAAGGSSSRRALPDLDFWSEDEDTLVGPRG